jgi:enoyl-CoA hydratase/carnithine racemase
VSDAEVVRYEVHDGGWAEMVMARPPLNLYGEELENGLVAAVRRAAAERPRALVFRSDCDVFTAGVDVHGFQHHDAEEYRRRAGADAGSGGPAVPDDRVGARAVPDDRAGAVPGL